MLLKIIIVIACVISVYIIWQWQELKKFARTDYEIKVVKCKENIRQQYWQICMVFSMEKTTSGF